MWWNLTDVDAVAMCAPWVKEKGEPIAETFRVQIVLTKTKDKINGVI